MPNFAIREWRIRPLRFLTRRCLAAMKMKVVIEAGKGSGWVQKSIGWMQRRPLSEIVAEPEIQSLYEPLYARRIESIALIRGCARQDGGVVFFDLAGYDVEGYYKFIPYHLFPSSIYTVSVSP